MSERLAMAVRSAVREFVLEDRDHDEAFDRFELLITLAYVHGAGGKDKGWFPPGRVTWRRQNLSGNALDPIARLRAEIAQEGDAWFLLQHPAFKTSLEQLLQAVKEMTDVANRAPY